jgi:hypothetical protein
MIELARPGEACRSRRRVNHGLAPFEECGRSAKYRVDGVLVCWQHGKALIAGREAEIAELASLQAAELEAAERRRIEESTPGFVYVIQMSGRTPAPLKIGFSREYEGVPKRLDGLQIGNPHELEIVAIRACTRGGENAIHRQLRAHWIRGEWFWPDQAVMRTVFAGTEPLGPSLADVGQSEEGAHV